MTDKDMKRRERKIRINFSVIIILIAAIMWLLIVGAIYLVNLLIGG